MIDTHTHYFLKDFDHDRYVMLETDAPYLIPSGCKGKRNTSLLLPAVVDTLAQAKGESPETIEAITTDNALRAFSLPEVTA